MARILEVLEPFCRAAGFAKKLGRLPVVCNSANAAQIAQGWAHDNTFEQRWDNAAGTDSLRGLSGDASNNILLSEEVVTPMYKTVKFSLSTAASISTQHFWIAPQGYRVVRITEIHATAETTAATLTGYVEKLSGTTAPGSGTALNAAFTLTATANTLQTATLSMPTTGNSDDPALQIAAGDRLGWVQSAASTELAGLVVVLTLAPGGTGLAVTYNMKANGDLVDQSIFVANRDYIVTAAYEVHSTLGTNASAVNVQITKDTGTDAPGAGTDILTNNTNAGFNLKGAINTVQTGTLTATAATLRLAPGNRLSVDFAGTLTAVAGLVVVVVLQPVQARKEVTFTLEKNANLADQVFFTADRNYEILAISEVHKTAGTDGSAVTMQVTRDTGTAAPGAGTDLLSNNSSAGFDMKGTANTVQVGTFVDTRFNQLMAGDRLAVDMAGTLTALAGVTVTVSLRPA